MKNRKEFEKILALLPLRTAESINTICQKMSENSVVNEIRMRLDRPTSLTVDDKNIVVPVRSTHSEIKGAVLALTGGSPYAYSDTIQKGYIPQKDGVRCGVCPNSKLGGSVDEITSLCIRIPWETEAPENIENICKKDGRLVSTLLYSPPGVGKTTVLRMLIKKLCSGENPCRGAVIDTKQELFTRRASAETLTDYLFGYSKSEGMELALRTLSPEIVFCDEIGSQNEADAILAAANTGVPLVLTAHSDSLESLMKRPQIKRLHDSRIFGKYVLIERENGVFRFKTDEA